MYIISFFVKVRKVSFNNLKRANYYWSNAHETFWHSSTERAYVTLPLLSVYLSLSYFFSSSPFLFLSSSTPPHSCWLALMLSWLSVVHHLLKEKHGLSHFTFSTKSHHMHLLLMHQVCHNSISVFLLLFFVLYPFWLSLSCIIIINDITSKRDYSGKPMMDFQKRLLRALHTINACKCVHVVACSIICSNM